MIGGGVLVLGFAIYLFVEVGASPAPAGDLGASSAASGQVAPQAAAARSAPAVSPVAPSTPAAPAHPTAALGRATAVVQRLAEPPAAPAASDDAALGGPKLDTVMDEANRAYDRGDYDDAKTVAQRVLARAPTNVRMLRVMVSASCIDGDGAVAQQYYPKLPPVDQEQMKVRCARYGISFGDKP